MTTPQDFRIEAIGRDATSEIQSAINTVSASGGGRVSLLAGEHMAGGLLLKSGVELHLRTAPCFAPSPITRPIAIRPCGSLPKSRTGG